MNTLPRADVRAQLVKQDDPKARERQKIYPAPYGMPVTHEFQVASAADLMDRFAGSTYGDVRQNVAADLRRTEGSAKVAGRLGIGLGATSLACVAGIATGALNSPLGVAITAAALAGTVVAAYRYEAHDEAAQDDRRLLAEMEKAGEALLADQSVPRNLR